MIQKRLIHRDNMALLLNILGDKKWKYGYEIAQELKECDKFKNELGLFGIYPTLIYMEHKRIIQSKKEWTSNRARIFYRLIN